MIAIDASAIERLQGMKRLLSKAELASVLLLTVAKLEGGIRRGEIPDGQPIPGGKTRWAPQKVAEHLIEQRAADDPLLMTTAVATLIGCHPSTLRAWVKNGEFIKPDKVVKGRPYWRKSRVKAWMVEKTSGLRLS